MSGFQSYLDGEPLATPREFLELAWETGMSTAKPHEVVAWLKAEYNLTHTYATDLAHLITDRATNPLAA